jgi:GNAT superfamily N-acetyltransferase
LFISFNITFSPKLITIEDLVEANMDDIFKVCSLNLSSDIEILHGQQLKRAWLQQMASKFGSIIKVAYWDGEPAAQVMFYPEEAIPYYYNSRTRVIEVQCIYSPKFKGKGLGDALMENLIKESRKGLQCLMGKKPRFLVAKPFNTGEGISLKQFYVKKGFKSGEDELFLEIDGSYEPKKKKQNESSYCDMGEATIYYNSNCEYSYRFAQRVKEKLNTVNNELKIKVLNVWENPEEFIADKMSLVNVNCKKIENNLNSLEFIKEVEDALKN